MTITCPPAQFPYIVKAVALAGDTVVCARRPTIQVLSASASESSVAPRDSYPTDAWYPSVPNGGDSGHPRGIR
jgi:hypothetical protein